MGTELPKPDNITTWVWLHHSMVDLALWQNCLVAACTAGAQDPIDVARKMYLNHGGSIKVTPNRRDRSSGA